MTTDLMAFLRVRLLEDEQSALNAMPDWPPGDDIALMPDSIMVGAHLYRHRPERVLAEIDAKRRIIEQHVPVGYGNVCLSYCHTRQPGKAQSWPCLTLRLLALPYAGHLDYQKEWAP